MVLAAVRLQSATSMLTLCNDELLATASSRRSHSLFFNQASSVRLSCLTLFLRTEESYSTAPSTPPAPHLLLKSAALSLAATSGVMINA